MSIFAKDNLTQCIKSQYFASLDDSETIQLLIIRYELKWMIDSTNNNYIIIPIPKLFQENREADVFSSNRKIQIYDSPHQELKKLFNNLENAFPRTLQETKFSQASNGFFLLNSDYKLEYTENLVDLEAKVSNISPETLEYLKSTVGPNYGFLFCCFQTPAPNDLNNKSYLLDIPFNILIAISFPIGFQDKLYVPLFQRENKNNHQRIIYSINCKSHSNAGKAVEELCRKKLKENEYKLSNFEVLHTFHSPFPSSSIPLQLMEIGELRCKIETKHTELSSCYLIISKTNRYFVNAKSNWRKGNYKATEEYFAKALRRNPLHLASLTNYALFLKNYRSESNTKIELCKELLENAIKSNPLSSNCMSDYAFFLETVLRDYEQADRYYKLATQLNPENVNNLCNYAVFLKKITKQYDLAEKFYKQAVLLDPAHTNALGNYALFLAYVRKDYHGAEDYFTRALRASKNSKHWVKTYGRFLQDMGKIEEANKYFILAEESTSPRSRKSRSSSYSFKLEEEIEEKKVVVNTRSPSNSLLGKTIPETEDSRFVEDFLTSLFTVNISTSEDIQKMKTLFKEKPGRIHFVQFLNFNRATRKCIFEKGTFLVLSDLIVSCLNEAETISDYIVGKILLLMSGTYYFDGGKQGPEYLTNYIKDCNLWKKDIFWEESLYDSIKKEREKLPEIKSWKEMNDEEKEDQISREQGIIFGILGSTLQEMKSVGVSIQQREQFLNRQIELQSQAELTKDQISSLRYLL